MSGYHIMKGTDEEVRNIIILNLESCRNHYRFLQRGSYDRAVLLGEKYTTSGCQAEWMERLVRGQYHCYQMLQHQEHPGYLCRTLKRAVLAFTKSLLFGRMASKHSILIQILFNQETSPDQSFPSHYYHS